MKFRLRPSRRLRAAQQYHESVEARLPLAADASLEMVLPVALRPPTPLDEARRQKMKARMLDAFDNAADTSRDDATHTLGRVTSQVAVAEVRTAGGNVRLADFETIDADRAHAAAAFALRLAADNNEGVAP